MRHASTIEPVCGSERVCVTDVQMLWVGGDATAIVLAIVAIWVSISAIRESRANYEKTLTALATVAERSALTERTVGGQVEKLVGSLLTVANAMAVPAEVRKAEMDRLGQEQQARIRSETIRLLSDAVKWADTQKVDAFVRVIQALEPGSGPNSGSTPAPVKPEAPAAPPAQPQT
jgi:hypothetical protein